MAMPVGPLSFLWSIPVGVKSGVDILQPCLKCLGSLFVTTGNVARFGIPTTFNVYPPAISLMAV